MKINWHSLGAEFAETHSNEWHALTEAILEYDKVWRNLSSIEQGAAANAFIDGFHAWCESDGSVPDCNAAMMGACATPVSAE